MTAVAEARAILPPELAPFSNFIKAFRNVINSCMRIQLKDSWEEDLEAFSTTLDILKKDFGGILSFLLLLLTVLTPAPTTDPTSTKCYAQTAPFSSWRGS